MMIYNSSLEELKFKEAFSSIDKKVIYLTFDDGPSSVVTNNILNILKQQHVKATFFVVGSMIKGKESVLKRIFLEGHSIGLHTYSHQYKQIYASEDAFIEEMMKTSEEIKKVIGIQPKIIRFPYGSNSHLNNAFLKKLHAHNFRVYDWNASISDGIRPDTSPNLFAREAIVRGDGIPYVIFLMHCNNTNVNTYKALPQIIEHYKKLGYEFRVITNDTPEFYWHFFN
ncbi:polysaccharide deacetylase family protein [Candidatus Clostridium radicumherbarum]|uniref:Polysaccharide deacetylase family protein n=1 Tax=Candidatus Clostridium radicumherbarum TaxID=3381662 RepID=A0ABW8TQM2_9CLOT